jgi:secreted trypsin-like serine protease
MDSPMRPVSRLMPLIALLLLTQLPASAQSLIQPRIINGTESPANAWPYMTALMNRVLGITVADKSYNATYLIGSPATLFSGILVDCGLATEPCALVKDNICLISRGNNTFASKVSNCEAGGGIGAIIYNNVEGTFLGTLQRAVTHIPAVSISQQDGGELLGQLGFRASFGYSNITPTQSFCGATWIGGQWVVTAAHCVADVAAEAMMVNIGGHDLETDQSNVIGVSEVLPHRDYNPKTINNDIALLELERAPASVTPIALASESQLSAAIAARAEVVMLGRGQQDPVSPGEDAPSTPTEKVLFEVSAPLVSNEVCSAAIDSFLEPDATQPTGTVTDAMVCAGRPEGNIGTCFGDSGGPMILQVNGRDYLAGITSWGIGCAQPGLYDVFTRVPFFKRDIEGAISDKTKSLNDDASTAFSGDATKETETSSSGGGLLSPGFFAFLLLLARTGASKHRGNSRSRGI